VPSRKYSVEGLLTLFF